MRQEQRSETRSRLTLEGWVVETVPQGTPKEPGQIVSGGIEQPPAPVVVVAEQVPLSVAQEVIAAHGMVAVPLSFLTAEQQQDLPPNVTKEQTPAEDPADPDKAHVVESVATMKADQAIARVKLAANFEELNALTQSEKRATVLAAAEERAAELKKGAESA